MKKITELNISVPWGHIAVKAWGSPTDFPVLLVHGLLDNAGSFNRLISRLPKEFYYIAIDLPGHGLSSHFAHGLTINYYDYILSLRLVVKEFKWKHFHYIGHSLGAQLGTFYSALYPNQIQKLVLIEGFVAMMFNEEIIPSIRRVHDLTIKFENEKDKLHTRDEVMHSLRCKRFVCLNTDAAEAILERSVSEIDGLLKYNRDVRLKVHMGSILNLEQIVDIFNTTSVEKLLLFITTGTTDSPVGKGMLLLKEILENIDNAEVKVVVGNHDVHNNYPDRLASHISKLFNEAKISSKL